MPAAYLINGVTPASIGVRLARRELRSMEVSRVVLDVVDPELVSPELLAYGTPVTVTRDGAAWFRGTVGRVSVSRLESSYSQQIEVRDAWQDLKDIQAEQSWNPDDGDQTSSASLIMIGAPADITAADADGAAGIRIGANQVMAHPTTGNIGTPPTAADESARLLGMAIYKGGAGLSVGNVTNAMSLVPRTLKNASVAEALKDISSTSPGQVSWFDYTTDPPTLQMDALGSWSTAVTLDCGPAGPVRSARITARDDMLLNSVSVGFEQTASAIVSLAAAQQALGGAPSTARALNLTFSLPAGGQWDTAGGSPYIDPSTGLANTPIPADFAAALLTAYGERYYEGEIVLKEDDVGARQFMGRVLNLTGALPAWAAMNMPIIGVVEDLLNGETTLTIGPNRNADSPGGAARAQRAVPPAARTTPETPAASPASSSHDPLETYLQPGTNLIYVAPGFCGQNASFEEVAVSGTGEVATIGLGGTRDIWLGCSITPDVQAFSVADSDGNISTEYLALGTGKVSTAAIRLSTAAPPAQPHIVNATSGAIVQMAVVYFKLASVTWSSGAAPSIQIFRKGNFDVVLIPPNRIYLKAMT